MKIDKKYKDNLNILLKKYIREVKNSIIEFYEISNYNYNTNKQVFYKLRAGILVSGIVVNGKVYLQVKFTNNGILGIYNVPIENLRIK